MATTIFSTAYAAHASPSGPTAANTGDLVRELQSEFDALPTDYVPGKTAMRDALVSRLGCSVERAEMLVDTLEATGHVRYCGSRTRIDGGPGYWEFNAYPRT